MVNGGRHAARSTRRTHTPNGEKGSWARDGSSSVGTTCNTIQGLGHMSQGTKEAACTTNEEQGKTRGVRGSCSTPGSSGLSPECGSRWRSPVPTRKCCPAQGNPHHQITSTAANNDTQTSRTDTQASKPCATPGTRHKARPAAHQVQVQRLPLRQLLFNVLQAEGH